MGSCTSYLSTRLNAVWAASHPCNVDGQTPPMIMMPCLTQTKANVLFCLFFNALIKAFRIIAQKFHSAIVYGNSKISGIIYNLETICTFCLFILYGFPNC